MQSEKEPTIKIEGLEYPLSKSETGAFGVSRAELQMIIGVVLRKLPSKRCSQRSLFRRVLSHMKIRGGIESVRRC